MGHAIADGHSLMAHVRRALPVDAYLERHDPANGAYITIDADAARRSAAEHPSGQLSDLVVAVKDLFDTAGCRTTYGSGIFADHVPSVDAQEVARFKERGAIVIGKTNLDEFANGVTGHNRVFGTMRIPSRTDLTASGSSGGSAVAVAEGSCDVALGTDSGGSVRLPAACCNVLGFKAAWSPDRLEGAHHLAPSFDSVGYLTKRFDVLERVLNIQWSPSTSHVISRHVDEMSLPPFPEADFWNIFQHELLDIHGEGMRSEPSRYGATMLSHLAIATTDLAASQRVLDRWRAAMTAAFAEVDVAIAPVMTGGPPTVLEALDDHANGTQLISARLLAHTAWVNALGWPALALPTASGPIQIVGPPGSEASILVVGKQMADLDALAPTR